MTSVEGLTMINEVLLKYEKSSFAHGNDVLAATSKFVKQLTELRAGLF
jgi:hypothetical protein